jgi:hypothetical protein
LLAVLASIYQVLLYAAGSVVDSRLRFTHNLEVEVWVEDPTSCAGAKGDLHNHKWRCNLLACVLTNV